MLVSKIQPPDLGGDGTATRSLSMTHQRRSPKKGYVPSSVTAYSLLIVASVIMVGPLFYIVSTSLKQTTQLFAYPPDWIPEILFWGNYSTLLGRDSLFLRWTLNTVLVAVVVTILKLIIDSMAGYAFAKVEFPGRRTLFILVLAVVMVPTSAVLISPVPSRPRNGNSGHILGFDTSAFGKSRGRISNEKLHSVLAARS